MVGLIDFGFELKIRSHFFGSVFLFFSRRLFLIVSQQRRREKILSKDSQKVFFSGIRHGCRMAWASALALLRLEILTSCERRLFVLL